MGQKTTIAWCDSTANPVVGCSGCELWRPDKGIRICYAGNIVENPKFGGRPGLFSEIRYFPDRVRQALAWSDLSGAERPGKPWLDGLPRTIFWNDMSDGFLDWKKWLDATVVHRMEESPHVHQLLTKRPTALLEAHGRLHFRSERFWLGTSVTSQASVGRVAHLVRVKTGRRNPPPVKLFVSVEPAWGPVDLGEHLKNLDWVLWGGESGRGSHQRGPELDWARRLRDACRRAGVAFFMKQVGTAIARAGKGEDLRLIPEDLRIRQMPMAPVGAAQQELFA